VAPRALSGVALAVVLSAGAAHAAGDRGDLFGRGYVSQAVLKDGEPHPLFKGTKIRVDFDHDAYGDSVGWRADCNYFVANVDITEGRLFLGQIGQTDAGCRGAHRRRDRWMSRFFNSDPKWRIRRDDKLKLTAGDRVIRLRKLTSPPPDR
jgi:heat shock protein HslJ